MPISKGLPVRDRSPMHEAIDFFAQDLFPALLKLEDLHAEDFFSGLFEAKLFEGAVVRALFKSRMRACAMNKLL